MSGRTTGQQMRKNSTLVKFTTLPALAPRDRAATWNRRRDPRLAEGAGAAGLGTDLASWEASRGLTPADAAEDVMTTPAPAAPARALHSLLALWLALAALAAAIPGCVVNPVPTPGSATGAIDNNGQGGDAQADAGKTSDEGVTGGGAADADSAVDAPTATTPDAAGDGGGELGGADGDGGGSVECCPLDPPGCDCVSVGGTKGAKGCVKVCDAAPVGWKKLVDQNGCPYWQTGPQSCMIAPVKCTDNPPSFPSFTKFCEVDDDCDFVVHQSDCCGNATAIGVWKAVKGAFASAESQCREQYPACGCPAMPPKAEDGKSSASSAFGVACTSGKCQTYVLP